MVGVCVVLLAVVGSTLAAPQTLSPALVDHQALAYPETERNIKVRNKQGRQPMYHPSQCKENQLYYPGDQADDWICDCRAGYLFHPDSDKCWPAWRRGPCLQRQYLIITNNNTNIPRCETNPCEVDGLVLYNGRCRQLDEAIPECNTKYPMSSVVLGVDAAYKIDCVKLSVEYV